jgi:hypothetical protein
MTVDYADLREFAEGCIESYQENSILSDICTVMEYNKQRHREKEYLGIGKRINLPKRFFSDPSTATVGIESDVGRAVFKGERNYMLREVRNQAAHGQIEDYAVEEFNYESLSQVLEGTTFTHIFLPLRKDADETAIDWLHQNSDVYFTDRKMYIERTIEDVRVHILPSDSEFGNNRAFALDSNSIRVVQKKKKRTDDPKRMELIDEYRNIGVSENLMIYFGKHNESPDKFDFLYRVLLSKPEIQPDGAAAIHIPVSD